MNRSILVLVAGCLFLPACSQEDSAADEEPRQPVSRADAGRNAPGPSRRAGPTRHVAMPVTHDSEHPLEPRVAADEPRVFRSAGRPGAARMARDATFAPAATSGEPVWYGLLHAHTLYSDGSGIPESAFERARNRGLDFLAVTAHNHADAERGASGARRDGVLIANDTDLYDGAASQAITRNFRVDGVDHTETLTAESLITAANEATGTDFVAIFGQEFSSISSGNHVNVLGTETVITIPNGEFAPLYEELAAATGPGPVLQMNHPDVHRDLFYRGSNSDVIEKMRNDYGFDEFGRDFARLVAAADPHIALVEVLSGPALDERIHPTYHYSGHRLHEDDYYYYLVQGFHLSPSVGQDNHFENWGDSTPARMGIIAPQLTRDGLMAAMRANRSFATEDTDLRIEIFVNDRPMGSVLTLPEDTPLDIEVHVADVSEPSANYTAELIYGDVEPQNLGSLDKWVIEDGLIESFTFDGDGVLTFDEYAASGRPEFFFVRLVQEDGDRAWSAPVWINHDRP